MLNILTSGLDDNQMLDTCDEEIRCVPLDCTSGNGQILVRKIQRSSLVHCNFFLAEDDICCSLSD